MSNSFRAAGWLSKDKQACVRLTTEEQSAFSDDELLKAAMKEARDIALEVGDGEIVISSWSE